MLQMMIFGVRPMALKLLRYSLSVVTNNALISTVRELNNEANGF